MPPLLPPTKPTQTLPLPTIPHWRLEGYHHTYSRCFDFHNSSQLTLTLTPFSPHKTNPNPTVRGSLRQTDDLFLDSFWILLGQKLTKIKTSVRRRDPHWRLDGGLSTAGWRCAGLLGWDLIFDPHITRVQVLLLIQRQFLHSTH